ncbi:DUF4412 domain-containing protein [Psychroflexus sp. MBR-150]|jgi:hypothetical protein
MKTTHLFVTLTLYLLLTQTVEAQFLKKLKNRVEQTVEDVVVDKTADKAAKKTAKTMDKAFDINPFANSGRKEKANPGLVANSYDFTWKYSLKMSTKKEGEIVFDYYLKPDAPYFGFTSATMENMFTIMDNGNKVIVMFMQSQGNNVGMVTQMPDDLDLEETKDQSKEFVFTSLPDKTINGYHCKGVKATNKDFEMDMYFTNEAEVSFDDIYKNQQTKIPRQVNDYFDKDEKLLMIYMDMKGLKKKKENMTMECIGLEEVSKTIKKSDYKFM